MTMIEKSVRRRVSASSTDLNILKIVAMFCGVGLLISLLFATYGMDVGFAFF